MKNQELQIISLYGRMLWCKFQQNQTKIATPHTFCLKYPKFQIFRISDIIQQYLTIYSIIWQYSAFFWQVLEIWQYSTSFKIIQNNVTYFYHWICRKIMHNFYCRTMSATSRKVMVHSGGGNLFLGDTKTLCSNFLNFDFSQITGGHSSNFCDFD